ncbi:MAG: conjugal transfer protein TraG N-terminal domain-containing protein, partial [Nitrospiria bacterium]
MNFNIYSYGNGDILIDTFNAIALIAGSSMINSAIMVAVLSGFLMFLTGGVFAPGHHHFNWKWLLGWVLILTLFWVPRANVQVVDQNYQFVNSTAPPLVPNVPLGLAVAAHLATTLGKGMTDMIETAFSDPSGISYSQNGLGFSQNLLSTSTQAYFPPGQVKADIDAYIESCVMLDILSGATNPATLANSQNLLNDIASSSARMVYLG